jgi:hypothetical protein
MATLSDTTVTRISSSGAASSANELVRLTEMEAALALKRNTADSLLHTVISDWESALTSGVNTRLGSTGDIVRDADLDAVASGLAPRVHTHTHDAITDWDQALESGVDTLIPDRATLVHDTDLDAVADNKAALNHTHLAVQVTDFDDALYSGVEPLLGDSPTIAWTNGATFVPAVRLKAGGHVIADADGLQTSGLATSTELAAALTTVHDEATVSGTSTLTLSLVGQRISGDVVAAPNSGVLTTPTGLALDFGTAANQVPRGNHTHAELHLALTVASTATLDLAVDGDQLMSGTVRLQLAPGNAGTPLAQDSAGLYVPSGTLAPYDHTHSNATVSTPGFMSSADKQLLNTLASGTTGEQCVTQYRADGAADGEWVGGRMRWAQDMDVTRVNCEAYGPASGTSTLALTVDGAPAGVTIEIGPSGTDTEVRVDATVTGVTIPANSFARWLVTDGPAQAHLGPRQIYLSLNVVPS